MQDFFFIDKLHKHPNSLELKTSPSTLIFQIKDMAFELQAYWVGYI